LKSFPPTLIAILSMARPSSPPPDSPGRERRANL
jgi:hypothetical protein